MGLRISTEHGEEEVERMRQAEQDLLEFYHLNHHLHERILDLPAKDQLPGITQARVWEINGGEGEGGDEDNDDAIPPVLLVHGGGGTPGDFAPLLSHFLTTRTRTTTSSQQYRFLVVERPGHGLSDPYDYSENVVDEFAAYFLSSVLESLGIADGKVHVVGNSFGGAYSIWFAKQFPEKVKSLSLLGVPAAFRGFKIPFWLHFLSSEIGRWIMAMSPPRQAVIDLYKKQFHSDMEQVPDVVIDNQWRAMQMKNNSLSWQSLIARAMPPPPISFGRSSMPPAAWNLVDLREMKLLFPILFVAGSDDNFMTPEQRSLVAEYIGEDNCRTLGKGHLPWLEDAEGIAEALLELWDE